MSKSHVVPFKSMGSRQRLGLSLVLLPMQHLSMQIIELHFIIVQQAKSACNIRNKLFQQTSSGRTTNSERMLCMSSGSVGSSSLLKLEK